MSSSLANSAKIAITAPAVGITDINQMPRMQNVNAGALAAASPRGLLKVTAVDMSGFDRAVESCKGLSFSQVQTMNRNAQVSSTETSCGWIQFTQSGSAGASALGTNFQPITMPEGVPAGAKYYPPVLTTSTKSVSDNWANAIPCISGSCVKETFDNPRVSSKYAGVNDAFVTPFLQQYPTPSATPLSRDKFIQVNENAGTMVATLYQDSERGLSDPSMETRSSYSLFSKAMVSGAQDKDSWQKAFLTSQPVGNDEYPRPSRDISVFATNLDEHDFCAEMNEQTIINENNLACLQREWLRKGGKATDYNYPDSRLYGSCYGRVTRK